MKLAIMQPYFFPYLGYFQLIQAADLFILYEHSQYIKKGWVNRNRLGKRNTSADLLVSVPIQHHKEREKIKDVLIQYQGNDWQRILLRQIYFNYCKSPFYHEVIPLIERCIQPRFEKIADLNVFIIQEIAAFLSIDTVIKNSSTDYDHLERTLEEMHEGASADGIDERILKNHRRTMRIIKICGIENCSNYLNPIGGQNLYCRQDFLQYGVKLQFLQMHPLVYPSITQPFLQHLSIIDVLMQNGKERTRELLNCYTLI